MITNNMVHRSELHHSTGHYPLFITQLRKGHKASLIHLMKTTYFLSG